MTKLQQILARHYEPAGVAGERGSFTLERDLRRLARTNAIIYAALSVLLTGIVVGTGVIVVMDAREGRGVRTEVLAGAGVSCPVILEMVRRSVHQWGQASLLAVLCRRLQAAQLQPVVEKLIEEQGEPRSRSRL